MARHACVSPEILTAKNYKERRKLTRFCWSAMLRAAAALSEAFASDPLLPWALTVVTRLLVRPSWRKKMRCPSPHNGAERNWSPPAPPCDTLSARPVPMWWTSRSENRLAVALPKPAVRREAWVVSDGVWQTAQPTELNSERPRAMEAEPPGTVVDGVGGARSSMNTENSVTSLEEVAALVPSE